MFFRRVLAFAVSLALCLRGTVLPFITTLSSAYGCHLPLHRAGKIVVSAPSPFGACCVSNTCPLRYARGVLPCSVASPVQGEVSRQSRDGRVATSVLNADQKTIVSVSVSVVLMTRRSSPLLPFFERTSTRRTGLPSAVSSFSAVSRSSPSTLVKPKGSPFPLRKGWRRCP